MRTEVKFSFAKFVFICLFAYEKESFMFIFLPSVSSSEKPTAHQIFFDRCVKRLDGIGKKGREKEGKIDISIVAKKE